MSDLSGQTEEHGVHVWPRLLPAVWGPDGRVSHLPQEGGEASAALLSQAQAMPVCVVWLRGGGV